MCKFGFGYWLHKNKNFFGFVHSFRHLKAQFRKPKGHPKVALSYNFIKFNKLQHY